MLFNSEPGLLSLLADSLVPKMNHVWVDPGRQPTVQGWSGPGGGLVLLTDGRLVARHQVGVGRRQPRRGPTPRAVCVCFRVELCACAQHETVEIPSSDPDACGTSLEWTLKGIVAAAAS